ncbi:MAG: DUF423 domain-containing protein [Planctomycetota bacterium]|jgi:uncharacterized membrane protein YgdD (TMEM256/DUF423 family)|nr:DUF423 domain-containing protein [Planctomycetota bacterium]
MTAMRLWLVAGAVLGGIGVAAGSFGAHGLKDTLEATGQAANWETSVRYCLVHALALLVVGLTCGLPQTVNVRGLLSVAGGGFLLGTLIFSGFLATLSLTGLRVLGAIVPIGGVLMLVGWTCLALAGFFAVE